MSKKKEKDAAQSFADFVNNNYKERMNGMHQIAKHFRPQEGEDEMEFMYDIGFITALNWIGNLLGVELAMPSKEDRDKIDKLFL